MPILLGLRLFLSQHHFAHEHVLIHYVSFQCSLHQKILLTATCSSVTIYSLISPAIKTIPDLDFKISSSPLPGGANCGLFVGPFRGRRGGFRGRGELALRDAEIVCVASFKKITLTQPSYCRVRPQRDMDNDVVHAYCSLHSVQLEVNR